MVTKSGRWPTVYDFEDLAQQIRELTDPSALEAGFYESSVDPSRLCQGDVIRLGSEIPFLDQDAAPRAEEPVQFWCIVGNTCDLERDIEDVTWSQIIPVWDIGTTDKISEPDSCRFRRYQNYKQFYLPAWNVGVADIYFVADFLRPVTIHKQGLRQCSVEARLSHRSWVLFHSCLIRFLARDDGRHG